jgi:hypothetical protein
MKALPTTIGRLVIPSLARILVTRVLMCLQVCPTTKATVAMQAFQWFVVNLGLVSISVPSMLEYL